MELITIGSIGPHELSITKELHRAIFNFLELLVQKELDSESEQVTQLLQGIDIE